MGRDVVAGRRGSRYRLTCMSWGFVRGVGTHSEPPNDPPAAARSEVWLYNWPEEGGPRLSASLRPGDPFLDQHITDVYGEARCQSGERERAGSSRWQKTECRNVRVRVKPGQQVGEGQKVDLERLWSLDRTEGTGSLRLSEEADGRTNRSHWI